LAYRELKRLDSVARSPIFALLGEAVDGATVIRAFGAQRSLFTRLIVMLDQQQHAYFLTYVAQSWLGVRLEMIGTLIITFACLSAVGQHVLYGFTPGFAGLAGLSISYALSVTQSLNWAVRMASDLEANMVSVERIREYTHIPNEGERKSANDEELPVGWPISGDIHFVTAQCRYRPELPLVLKGLNLHIPSGSKVGVVGRTGAGKSTLMVALMRIVELSDGEILIDGTNIQSIGLATLRSNLAVVPQDPVLFSGTIRTNLDPFDEYSDDNLLEALEHVGLFKGKTISSSIHTVASESNIRVNSINDEVAEGGTNFSVGQRQLIVIARALLRGAKIVIMDEATAAIDAETDESIQKVLRIEFAGATCLTVAHRLNTIMDSDYILVMDDGKAAEFDTPQNLLKNGGMFRDLVQAARFD
jgi:ABC-type multidrug transport system fused ATPase/permease subunit